MSWCYNNKSISLHVVFRDWKVKWNNQNIVICTSYTNLKKSLNLNTSFILEKEEREHMANLYLALLNLINQSLTERICLMYLNKCLSPLVSVSPEKIVSILCFQYFSITISIKTFNHHYLKMFYKLFIWTMQKVQMPNLITVKIFFWGYRL